MSPYRYRSLDFIQNSVDRTHKNEHLNIMYYFDDWIEENRQEHNLLWPGISWSFKEDVTIITVDGLCQEKMNAVINPKMYQPDLERLV